MMTILVKGDDVRSEKNVNACHGWLLPARESMGKTGLIFFQGEGSC